MMLAALTSLIYGSLVLAGGIMGYRKAHSRASLLSGLLSAAFLILAAILIFRGDPIGLRLATVVALLLLVFFAMRWLKGKKFMPAGLMVMSSALALALLAWGGS
ncbi:MAG: hypothetical protein L0170_09805 [Acidobacteria bacterium]|nr:hypothetical protein [Acidobacteriota bacterium]